MDEPRAGFRDQVLCTKYTDSGDSGSLVCDMQGVAVGLHWAGSQSVSIFSPIAFVFQQLDISLWSRSSDGRTGTPDVPAGVSGGSMPSPSSDSGPLVLALDQNAEDLARFPGVQGIGLDVESDAVVVFVDRMATAAEGIPTHVSAVDEHGKTFVVRVIVREIGTIIPE